MTQFKIPLTIEFDASVIIDADTNDQAIDIATAYITAKLENDDVMIGDNHIRNITFNPNGYIRPCFNESIKKGDDEE